MPVVSLKGAGRSEGYARGHCPWDGLLWPPWVGGLGAWVHKDLPCEPQGKKRKEPTRPITRNRILFGPKENKTNPPSGGGNILRDYNPGCNITGSPLIEIAALSVKPEKKMEERRPRASMDNGREETAGVDG